MCQNYCSSANNRCTNNQTNQLGHINMNRQHHVQLGIYSHETTLAVSTRDKYTTTKPSIRFKVRKKSKSFSLTNQKCSNPGRIFCKNLCSIADRVPKLQQTSNIHLHTHLLPGPFLLQGLFNSRYIYNSSKNKQKLGAQCK